MISIKKDYESNLFNRGNEDYESEFKCSGLVYFIDEDEIDSWDDTKCFPSFDLFSGKNTDGCLRWHDTEITEYSTLRDMLIGKAAMEITYDSAIKFIDIVIWDTDKETVLCRYMIKNAGR